MGKYGEVLMLSRRTLLAGGGALAALAGVTVPAVVLPSAAPGRFLFGEAELVLIQAVGEALFPPGNPLGVAGEQVDLATRVDELLGDALDAEVGTVFRYVLRALENGTIASRGMAFSTLRLDDRIDVLNHWEDTGVLPRRMAYDALRLVYGMAFMTTPEVLAVVGWSARCQGGST